MKTRLIDLTGKRYGRLKVIGLKERDRFGNLRWDCRCDCGESSVVRGDKLREGITNSCGCLKLEFLESCKGKPNANRKGEGESARNSIIDGYKRNAAKRNLNWELNNEETIALFESPCYYCGLCKSNTCLSYGRRYGQYEYNGIDRFDNKLGYIPGNCVPCCKLCNWAKRDLTFEEFNDWIDRLIDNKPKRLHKVTAEEKDMIRRALYNTHDRDYKSPMGVNNNSKEVGFDLDCWGK